MKSFLQFMIPIFIILIIGGILMYNAGTRDENRRLYIACNNSSMRRNRFNVFSTKVINFMENDENCSLVIEVLNVAEHYVKLSTPNLLHYDLLGELENFARNEVFVSIDYDTILYSTDGETKFTFRFR